MADILISCPETGRPVPTGLTTDMIILENLPPVAVPLRCRRAGTCTHGTGGRLGSQRPETRSLSLGRSRRSSSWSFRMPAAGDSCCAANDRRGRTFWSTDLAAWVSNKMCVSQ